jgi:acetylornithine/N-succinyldiaminopimelate aminotransferase
VVSRGYDRRLILVNAGPNVLRLVPPLVITEAEIQQVAATIGEILSEL